MILFLEMIRQTHFFKTFQGEAGKVAVCVEYKYIIYWKIIFAAGFLCYTFAGFLCYTFYVRRPFGKKVESLWKQNRSPVC